MNIKDNGGPAFPMIRDIRHNPDWDHEEGMTLRDYFAAKAMQTILSQIQEFPDENWRVGVAKDAYMMADAMLAERAK